MTIDRTAIVLGPGIVTFNSQVFYSKDDIIATPVIDTFKVETSMFGDADERLDNIAYEIAFTPAGQWIAAHLPVLWPHSNPVVGASVYGGADLDLVVTGIDGRQMTFHAAAVSQMPTLRLSAKETPMGQITFISIGANDTAWSDASKRSTEEAQAFADTSYVQADTKTVPYTSVWGAVSPWDSFETEDGWTIDFELDLQDIMTDSDGIVDKRVGNATGIIARAVPQGVTAAQLETLLAVQGTGKVRGTSLSANANDLVIAGGSGNPTFTLNDAAPKAGPFRWGGTVVRTGEVAFVAVPAFTSGARDALFTVGTVA